MNTFSIKEKKNLRRLPLTPRSLAFHEGLIIDVFVIIIVAVIIILIIIITVIMWQFCAIMFFILACFRKC